MEIASGIVVYVMLWWWIFFMALPFGVSRQTDGAAGHDAGAPKRPLLARKVIITSLLALILWVVAYFIIDSGMISFREMSRTL